MPSPKPKPEGLKIMEGRAPGRDSGGRPVKAAPAFVRLPPEPPEWLSSEARAEWDRVVPELQRLELTKPLDRAALSAYCEAWARFVAAKMAIKVDGLFVTNSHGVLGKHPAVLIAESASKELRAWCGEFGFSPSAEMRVTLVRDSTTDEDNPFGGA